MTDAETKAAGYNALVAAAAAERARGLSAGAGYMLLHIARVRPLPKPFPPIEIGAQHLDELRDDLVVFDDDAPSNFVPTPLGFAVASLLQKETP